MRVLIVDDDYEKARKISELISSEAAGEVEITHESTARAARIKLRNSNFDLLLIDINLPDTVGAAPASEGGFRLFDMIVLDSSCAIPGEVLFISSVEPSFREGRENAKSRGVSICEFSPSDDSWKGLLRGKLKIARNRAKNGTSLRCDVAIITALAQPELDAVLKLPYDFKPLNIPSDPTTYYVGSFLVEGKAVSVVAASAVKKGMAFSAALATKLVLLFNPSLLVMNGICAGVEGKTALGDVVVGDPTWDWGSGKHVSEPDGSPVFRLSPVQRPLNTQLAQRSSQLASNEVLKREIAAGWTDSLPKGKFSIHIGPMASGASVLADKAMVDEIVAQNRDVIAVEMEAFAVMAACEAALSPPPIAIAIKSVCDFANSSKDDDWQRYAAYTSARFTDALLKAHFEDVVRAEA